MLTEDELYLYAASRGWLASVEVIHADEYVRGVFLTRGSTEHFWGPLGAVRRLTPEQVFVYLERLNEERACC